MSVESVVCYHFFYEGLTFVMRQARSYIIPAIKALQALSQFLSAPCKPLSRTVSPYQEVVPLPENSINSLIDDPLKIIIELVGPQASKICKRFAALHETMQEAKWEFIKNKALDDSFLSYLIKEAESCQSFNAKIGFIFQELEKTAMLFESGSAILNNSLCYKADSLDRFEYIRGWLKDKNFLIFFEKIALLIPEANRYLGTLQGGIREKAKLLKEWMYQNPQFLGSLIDLERLNLGGENLTEIPEEIHLCSGLRSLDLSYNRLREIPNSIVQIEHLEELNLYQNQLEKVPDSLCKLKNLIQLRLDWNNLTKCPEDIYRLENLEELSLSNNKLTEIPERIGRLRHLQALYLSYNYISQIPDSIRSTLNHLEKFDIRGNQLTTMDKFLSLISERYLIDVS